jgi:hypothetical protein
VQQVGYAKFVFPGCGPCERSAEESMPWISTGDVDVSFSSMLQVSHELLERGLFLLGYILVIASFVR